MQFLSQSPFLQALGYAIANSLWQTALIWIAVVLLNSIKKTSSATRYSLAVAGQLLSFVWFLISLQFYYIKCSEQILNKGVLYTTVLHPAETSSHSVFWNITWRLEQFIPYLSVAYIFLLMLLFFRFCKNYKNTQQIKTAGLQKMDVHWRLFVNNMASRLSIKQEVKIFISSIVNSPLTLGFLKPVILIPVASINHLTSEQMEAVILHELAHIKRADYLYNLLISIVEITLFFNPFTQLISKIIKKERENSCDDWVLQFQYNASMYAEALLQIAYLQTTPLLSMNASGKTKGDLLLRIKRIIQPKNQTFNYRQQLLALLLMTGIFSCIAWYEPLHYPHQKIAASTVAPQHKTLIPLSVTIDNPFFSPLSLLPKPLQEKQMETVKKDEETNDVIPSKSIKDTTVLDLRKKALLIASIKPEQFLNEVIPQIQNDFSKADGFKIAFSPKQDTAAINEQMKLAFDKANMNINLQKINEDIFNAKKQLQLLQENKQLFFAEKQEIFNQLNAAFEQLKYFKDFDVSTSEFSDMINDLFLEQMVLKLKRNEAVKQEYRNAEEQKMHPKVLFYRTREMDPENISLQKNIKALQILLKKRISENYKNNHDPQLKQCVEDAPKPAFVYLKNNLPVNPIPSEPVFFKLKDASPSAPGSEQIRITSTNNEENQVIHITVVL